MARYAKEHKQQTRQQILRAARRMLQTRGVEGTAIPALMGEAGLTHGGFYAYFRNKTDLLAEVCAGALRRRSDKLAAAAASPTPGKEMAEFIDDHLGINSGSQPLTSGRGGFGFSVQDVTRRAYFDHIELFRQA